MVLLIGKMKHTRDRKENEMASSKYNATVYQSIDGKGFGTFLAEVNEAGKMLRSNWIQFTQYDGTDIYDMYIRMSHEKSEFTIVRDNGQGYKNRLMGLALPPEIAAGRRPALRPSRSGLSVRGTCTSARSFPDRAARSG